MGGWVVAGQEGTQCQPRGLWIQSLTLGAGEARAWKPQMWPSCLASLQPGRAPRSADSPSQEAAQGGVCLRPASSSSQKVFGKLQPGTLDLCWMRVLESLGTVSRVKGGIFHPLGTKTRRSSNTQGAHDPKVRRNHWN